VDKEAGGQIWWTKRQVASCGGKRGMWTVVVDKEAGGRFSWTKRQLDSFGGQRGK
jgi:hypothetical protein